MKKKVIFLDVDGVLSSFGIRGLSAHHLDLFAGIVHITGADVVLSSTWRMPHCREQRMRLQHELHLRGIELAGMTPVINQPIGRGGLVGGVLRGDEIKLWLRENETDQFVILDDDPNDEMGDLKAHLVKCDGYKGLSAAECDEVVARLGGKPD